jgi:hypothetical protein
MAFVVIFWWLRLFQPAESPRDPKRLAVWLGLTVVVMGVGSAMAALR